MDIGAMMMSQVIGFFSFHITTSPAYRTIFKLLLIELGDI